MSFLPKKSAIDGSLTRDNVVLRCGDCMHLKGTKHPSFNERCAERGVKTGAVAPPCYTPNVTVFRRHSLDTFRILAAVIRSFSPQESRVLMGILHKSNRLEKFGFNFLDKVYFRLGDEYLNNFYSGYVLAVGIERTLLIIGAKQLENKRPMIAHLEADSVYSVDKFRRVKKRLVENGLLNDPETRRLKLPRTVDVDYEPPTIDSAQTLLQEKAVADPRKPKGRVKHEVTEDGEESFVIGGEENESDEVESDDEES